MPLPQLEKQHPLEQPPGAHFIPGCGSKLSRFFTKDCFAHMLIFTLLECYLGVVVSQVSGIVYDAQGH